MKDTFFDYSTRSIINLIPLAHSDKSKFWVSRVNTPPEHRGKGAATQLMTEMLQEADRQGIELYLGIYPSGDLDVTQLRKWYERFGFTQDPRHPDHYEALYRPAK
jgi:GNAT superfamily N-acetyltransferase